MNVFEFEDKLSRENNGKVNLIYQSEKGFHNVRITHKQKLSDVKSGKIIFYKTILLLKKNSKSFMKGLPTFLIQLNGTDFQNASVIEI